MADDKPKEEWAKPSMVDLLAASGAAATATMVGGQLGVAGTVIGAAIASAVTTVALSTYKNLIRKAHAVTTPLTTAFTVSTPETPTMMMPVQPSDSPAPSTSALADVTAITSESPSASRPRRALETTPTWWAVISKHWTWIVAGIVIATVIGIVAILAAERVSGQAFTPGTAQIQQHNDPKFPGPSPKPVANQTATASPAPSVTPTPVASPSATPKPSPSMSPTPAPTVKPSESPTPAPTVTP